MTYTIRARSAYNAGVMRTLDRPALRAAGTGKLFSSSFVALNLQVRNSGFCELRFNPVAAQVVSFNNVPHLDLPDRRQFITFS